MLSMMVIIKVVCMRRMLVLPLYVFFFSPLMFCCVLTSPFYDWREYVSECTLHHDKFLVLLSLANKLVLKKTKTKNYYRQYQL